VRDKALLARLHTGYIQSPSEGSRTAMAVRQRWEHQLRSEPAHGTSPGSRAIYHRAARQPGEKSRVLCRKRKGRERNKSYVRQKRQLRPPTRLKANETSWPGGTDFRTCPTREKGSGIRAGLSPYASSAFSYGQGWFPPNRAQA
jgi:hypothetical protein